MMIWVIKRYCSFYRPRGIKSWLGIFLLSLTLLFYSVPAHASTPEPRVPGGFYLISEDHGIRLYRKNYAEGNPDYIQVIDLREGATLKLMYGQLGEPRKGKGMYGGDDARFSYQTLRQFWNQSFSVEDRTFCVFNGLFFYMPENPTRLAMPLKIDGEIITSGFGYPQYDGEELMLELWTDEARISELTQRGLQNSTALHIISGLTENANKRAKYAVGRTFLAVLDQDGDRISETILVLNTLSATQSHAANVLREWGAEKVMMLDGGGSTQLYCRDGWKVESERLIPQAIAAIAGSGPPYVAEFSSLPDWSVVVAQEGGDLPIEVTNRGVETWEVSKVELNIQRLPWGTHESIPLPSNVPPEGAVTINWPAELFYQSGIYDFEIGMTQNEREFPGEPVGFRVIALPPELASKRSQFEQELEVWVGDANVDVEAQVNSWIQAETADAPSVRLTPFISQDVEMKVDNILWVPVLMLPFVAFLVLLLGRIRSVE